MTMAVDMIYYASVGKKKKVRDCLQNGVFVDAMNFKNETALLFAAKNGHLPIVTLLLNFGADPNWKNADGLTPTIAAAIRDHTSCLLELLDKGGVWCPKDEETLWLLEKENNSTDASLNSHEIPQENIFLSHQSRCIDVSGIYTLRDCRIENRSCLAKIELSDYLSIDGENKLQKEYEMLRALRHPNVIKPYHTSTSNEMKYNILLMEPITNANLYHVLHVLQHKITVRRGNNILRQAIQAMVFLHSQKIIHNFLNPTSIYLTCDWVVKIGNLEYGCYGGTSAGTQKRMSSMPVAAEDYNLLYTAPEIIRESEYSKSSDVYSLGCIAWEMFGRKQPWSWLEKNDVIALAQITHHVRLPLQEDWPIFLNIIVKQCTDQKKMERPSFAKLYYLISENVIPEESFVNPSRFKVSPVKIVKHDSSDNLLEDFPDSHSATCPHATNERTSRVQFGDVTTIETVCSINTAISITAKQPRKSCLRSPSLRSSLIKRATSSNTQMAHPSCTCNKISMKISKPSLGESMEKLINIQTIDSDFNDGKEDSFTDGKKISITATTTVSDKCNSLIQQSKFLQNMEAVIADTETLFNWKKEGVNMPFDQFDRFRNDKEMTNKIIQETFKIAGKHQKENWAQATMVDRDLFGDKCSKSKSW